MDAVADRERLSNMIKTILLIAACSISFYTSTAYCLEDKSSHNSVSTNSATTDHPQTGEERSDSNLWQQFWGKKARDALLLGMWSLHLDGTGEYFGNGSNNDQNHLIGIQYYGLSAGTFINSHDDRAWYFGPAREVYSRHFTDDIRFDIGYKFGLLYGYGDDLINVGGMSVFAAATFGISWKRLGFDLGIIPAAVITGNFRIDIDF
jgi:hypothetical protein